MRKIWGSHTGVGEDFGLPPWLRVDGYMSSNVSDDLMPASSEQSTKKRSFLFGLPKKLIQFAPPKHWYEYINTRGVISKKTGISILCFYNLNGDNNGWIVDGQDSLRINSILTCTLSSHLTPTDHPLFASSAKMRKSSQTHTHRHYTSAGTTRHQQRTWRHGASQPVPSTSNKTFSNTTHQYYQHKNFIQNHPTFLLLVTISFVVLFFNIFLARFCWANDRVSTAGGSAVPR